MTRIGSLCSGYGGLDLAVAAYYEATVAWHAEVDKDCDRVLTARFLDDSWPDGHVPNLGDLTELDGMWGALEPVGILCAGFPCQPFSNAGLRKGSSDERAIFQFIATGISVLRPCIIVLENVPGLISTGPGRGGGLDVVATLTGLGYDCRWGVVRASDASAPHRRARWFCIARNTDDGVVAPIGTVPTRDSTDSDRTGCIVGDTDAMAGSLASPCEGRPGEVAQSGTVERSLRPDGDIAADASDLGPQRSGASRQRGTGFADGNQPAADSDLKRSSSSSTRGDRKSVV